jgi:hypothetical protein
VIILWAEEIVKQEKAKSEDIHLEKPGFGPLKEKKPNRSKTFTALLFKKF